MGHFHVVPENIAVATVTRRGVSMTPYGSVGASKQIDSRKDRQNKSREQFMALVI